MGSGLHSHITANIRLNEKKGGDPKSGKINSSDLLSIDLLGHVDLLCCQGALEACAPL